MHSSIKRLIVKAALPWAVRWVQQQEERVLKEGRPLTEWEMEWAADVSIERPEKVRVLEVNSVPTPGKLLTTLAEKLLRTFSFDATGMAVRYGIYLNVMHSQNPSLLVHEMAHVAQYERLGGIQPFLKRYLDECLEDGYWDSSLEREARKAAAPFPNAPSP
ncbi:MAG: hypothetical protein AAF226_07080 [Verrucomicrobiota bacterium]